MKFRSVGALAIAGSVLVPGSPPACQEQPSIVPDLKPKICVVTPDVQFGQGMNASGDPSAPVKASLIAYLSGPAADVVALQSRIKVQANAEAIQQGCTYVVDATVTHKKAGKGMKSLLAMAPALASVVPFVGGSGTAGYAAGAVASAAAEGMAAAQQEDWMAEMTGMAQSNIKKGDVILLKYILYRPDTTAAVASSELQGKAADNGEDILSPLIEQTATEILSASMAPSG